jgi:hypothetical protein
MDFQKKTAEIEKVVNDFIMSTLPKIEQKIDNFPSVKDIFKGKTVDIKEIARRIAEYEFYQVKISNMMSEVTTKKINLKNYIRRVKFSVENR